MTSSKIQMTGIWKETAPGYPNAPSIWKQKLNHHYDDVEHIIKYLENGVFIALSMGFEASILNPEVMIPKFGSIQTDGIWIWHHELYYYVRDHGLLLEKSFLKHIREHMKYTLPELSKEVLSKIDSQSRKYTFQMLGRE